MSKNSFWTSGKGIAACLLIIGVVYMLLMEHREHVFQYLPFLIILLCPLMHIFMHGGHGGHGEHEANDFHQKDAIDEAYKKGLEEGRKNAR
jgi:hypothetical protein